MPREAMLSQISRFMNAAGKYHYTLVHYIDYLLLLALSPHAMSSRAYFLAHISDKMP